MSTKEIDPKHVEFINILSNYIKVCNVDIQEIANDLGLSKSLIERWLQYKNLPVLPMVPPIISYIAIKLLNHIGSK
jgi:hypothetical protein